MRFKVVSLLLIAGISLSLSAKEIKSRSGFFKEFYGTYLKPLEIEVDLASDTLKTEIPDIETVISQYESRYSIRIPEDEAAAFETPEDVAAWVRKYLDAQAAVKTEYIESIESKPVKKRHSWRVKLYGSFGPVECEGVTGGVAGGGYFDGNLFGAVAFKQFNEMYTWEAGFALNPSGWTGKSKRQHSSWGLSYDYAQFRHLGSTRVYEGRENDTTATRWGINLNFQQNLTGINKANPKIGLYIMESLRFGVHSFGFIDPVLRDINHLSFGFGLAQGLYFYIFDLKFYQSVAYSPDIASLLPDDFSFLRSLYLELGLRLGVALKL